jgi:hypothetical protein
VVQSATAPHETFATVALIPPARSDAKKTAALATALTVRLAARREMRAAIAVPLAEMLVSCVMHVLPLPVCEVHDGALWKRPLYGWDTERGDLAP